jgi:hypothetical protein
MLQLHILGEKGQPVLKAHFPQIANAGQLASDVVELLETSDLISTEKRERINKHSELWSSSKESNHTRSPTQILDSIKSGGLLDRSSHKQDQNGDSAAATGEVHIIYLPASDKVLMSRNNELKLVSRSSRGNGEFFEDPMSCHLGNHIHDILDDTDIFISPSELKCLADSLDWSKVENDLIISSFLERFETSYNGQSVRVPYFEALLSIKGLICVALQQFKQIEDLARVIEAQDLTLREQPDDATTSKEGPEN